MYEGRNEEEKEKVGEIERGESYLIWSDFYLFHVLTINIYIYIYN